MSDSAAASVHERLRQLILTGDLPPGSVLSQVRLAEDLGVSRTPLRDAMRRLQSEGLIDAEHNRRARVADIDPSDLQALYCQRILVESLAISLTVERLSEVDLQRIRDALAEMLAAAAEERSYEAWDEPHRRFHALLVMHAGERLRDVTAGLVDRSERYRRLWLYRTGELRSWELAEEEHTSLLEACEAREARLAAERLARHLGRTALSLLMTVVPEEDPRLVRGAIQMVVGSERP
jgi:DNA-binding GntR family transcriptional regulator